jgi:hypothetical protein
MTDDLVKRLRGPQSAEVDYATRQEAADRIEALTAQLQVSNELGRALEEDAGQLRADNARLRKALTFYADEENYKSRLSTDPCGCCTTWDEPIIHIYGDDSGHIARAALTGKEPSHE